MKQYRKATILRRKNRHRDTTTDLKTMQQSKDMASPQAPFNRPRTIAEQVTNNVYAITGKRNTDTAEETKLSKSSA